MILRLSCILVSALVFAAAIGWPAIALVWRSIQEGTPPRDGFWFSPGQFLLLARTVAMALTASFASLMPGIIAGVFLGSRRPHAGKIALLSAGLLCPPMVYAFGWQKLLPIFVAPEIRCVLVWVLWAWPLVAIVIAAGWSRTGKDAYVAALLDCSPASAWLRVGLPAVKAHILAAFLLTFVLFLGDYGVPHAFGLRVYATELLAWASESNHAIDALWASLPTSAVTLVVLVLIVSTMRRCGPFEGGLDGSREAGPVGTGILLAAMAAGWMVPLAGLLKPLTWFVVKDALRTYGPDLVCTLGVASFGASLSLLLGLAAAPFDRLRRKLLYVALLFGSLPGAVAGQSLIAAYNTPQFSLLYDSWVIVSLAYVARYAWLGLLVGGLVRQTASAGVVDQARTDGASPWQIGWHVLLPQAVPILVGTAAIIVALAAGDVAASTLVRVPGYNPIAHVIIEKFHRFEDGMLVVLSLMLVATAMMSAALVGCSQRALKGLAALPDPRQYGDGNDRLA